MSPSAPRHLSPSLAREPNLHCAQCHLAAAGRAHNHGISPAARRQSAAERDRRAGCPRARCSFAHRSSGSSPDSLRTRYPGRRKAGRDGHVGERNVNLLSRFDDMAIFELAICESGERHLMVHRSGALKWIGKTVEHRPSKTNHETNHNSAAGAGS